VLIGIPEARIAALTADFAGLDLVAEAEAGGTGMICTSSRA
jgi:NosR/NirI family transcriptional regulator, nitrous oxide reductase regulator